MDNQAKYALKVNGLYKKFPRDLKRSMTYGTIDIFKSMLGLRVNSDKLRKSEFWAIKNLSFRLRRNEVLGVIGANGSGKSSLLRVITGIFPPDAGEVIAHGQIGALIAVGAGFHPHMTGRENIYLNGTILGMSKKEIDQCYDSIVEFAEIGDFLESPVSTYSSGMKVKLGFSIAIHRVPEILLIDEVLAVGDAAFKKKCLEKMEEIKTKTSIIFISHDMYQIERICDRVILMDKGELALEGKPEEVIDKYYELTLTTADSEIQKSQLTRTLHTTKDIDTVTVELDGVNLEESVPTLKAEPSVKMLLQLTGNTELNGVLIGVEIYNSSGIFISSIKNLNSGTELELKRGNNNIELDLDLSNLVPDRYRVQMKIKTKNNTILYEGIVGRFIMLPKKGKRYDGLTVISAKWRQQ